MSLPEQDASWTQPRSLNSIDWRATISTSRCQKTDSCNASTAEHLLDKNLRSFRHSANSPLLRIKHIIYIYIYSKVYTKKQSPGSIRSVSQFLPPIGYACPVHLCHLVYILEHADRKFPLVFCLHDRSGEGSEIHFGITTVIAGCPMWVRNWQPTSVSIDLEHLVAGTPQKSGMWSQQFGELHRLVSATQTDVATRRTNASLLIPVYEQRNPNFRLPRNSARFAENEQDFNHGRWPKPLQINVEYYRRWDDQWIRWLQDSLAEANSGTVSRAIQLPHCHSEPFRYACQWNHVGG